MWDLRSSTETEELRTELQVDKNMKSCRRERRKVEDGPSDLVMKDHR